jgi:anti-anti-sigma regulatory factor
VYSKSSQFPLSDGACAALTARIDVSRGSAELSGHLHGETVHVVDDAMTALLLTGRRYWRVHVPDLFIWDRSGLRAIGVAHRRALAGDRHVILVGASPELRRTLELLGPDHHLLGRGGV